MHFGDNLRKLRLESGLTQAEVAEKIGVTQALVAQYEANGKVPNVNLAAKIAALFNVTVDYMLSESAGS